MQRAANLFRATFFSFWVVRKLATVNSEPSKSYQTGVTWGRPSGRAVARAATWGWLRKALTSAEIGTGRAPSGIQGRPHSTVQGKGASNGYVEGRYRL